MNRASVVWSAVRNWGQRLGAVLTFFVLVRLLTQQEIAIFAAAAAVMALLDLFTDNGLGDSVVQAKAVPPAVSTALLVINLGIALLLYLGVQMFAEQISVFLGIEGAENVLRVAAIVLPLNSISFVPQALMRKEFQFKRLAMRSLAATVLSAVVGIVMAAGGLGVWSMVAQFLVFGAVNAVMAWHPPILKPARPAFAASAPFIKFGSRVFATRILYYSSTRVMEILLPVLFGPTALAIYFMSVRLPAVLSQLLVTVVTDLGLPSFSKLADDPDALIDAFYNNLIFAAGVSVPAFFLLGALAPEITWVAFGENGRGSEHLLLPLAIVSAFQSVGAYNQIVLNSRGMSGISLWLSLANAALAMVVFYVARNTDLYTFIYAYALSQCILIPLYFFVGGHFSGISFRRLVRIISPYFASSSLSLAVVWLVRAYFEGWSSPIPGNAVMHDIVAGVSLGVVFGVVYIASLLTLDRNAAMTICRQLMRREKAA
ncbi:oligosaccharide flippase family protein [Rhizobium sp. 007]|uniref:oligosaccharide flippase family protein n=1 Tax=Rhizobium sp. 007 TaxID=2785056 RepID=UPI00188F2ACB|nr:oligosaccharide flippase family protein [Rhizobium sp. 007]QPB22381.1 oligosaccharide flippase family protein [Rhizobium sp. 007]